MNSLLTPLFFDRLGRMGAMLFLAAVFVKNSGLSIWLGLVIVIVSMISKLIAQGYAGQRSRSRNDLIKYAIVLLVIIAMGLSD